MDADLAADEWLAAYERVAALVMDAITADPETMNRHVPACPAWTAKDLLAHVIGVDADTLADREDDDHNPHWTQAQVDVRVEATVEELLGEWSGLAQDVASYIRGTAVRPLGDLIIHEQDLRGALHVPGAHDTEGLRLIRDRMAGRLGAALEPTDLMPLGLNATDEDWTWRSREGEPGLVLEASGFDLFRAVTSRRAAEQLAGYAVIGSVEPYLPYLSAVGPLPEHPLSE